MRLVPGGTSTTRPSMVSVGMASPSSGNERLELAAELFDVRDVGPDGAVIERADGGARPPARHVEDLVEVVLLALALHDAVGHLVDPARRLPTGRALSTALVGVEASHHHQRLRDRD